MWNPRITTRAGAAPACAWIGDAAAHIHYTFKSAAAGWSFVLLRVAKHAPCMGVKHASGHGCGGAAEAWRLACLARSGVGQQESSNSVKLARSAPPKQAATREHEREKWYQRSG